MSNLTPEQNRLSQAWSAVHQGAGQALEWIHAVRGNAPRLDSEADSFSLKLHRARNLASSLGRVAGTPMTIGFFGLSQAGKSYLISALAASQNGKLETLFGDARLDFIQHVNPVGGGKEATGLVTRFSRSAQSGPADFPIEFKLFSEIEIAKILANAWFKDFDQDKIDYEIDEARINRILKQVEGSSGTGQAGVNADDVVSLMDYIHGLAEKMTRKLEHSYWPKVLELAPRLNYQQRAELFSILWGELPELTRTYSLLAGALQRLGSVPRVYAPLQALVSREGDDFKQRDSIMNVDILSRLGTSSDLPIDVRPARGDELLAPVSVPTAQLAALTAEMIFPLVNPTQDPRVEQVDLLDFPGYRTRKGYRAMADIHQDDNAISQLILRGKVAYLFERYTDNQEMNGLVICTRSDAQIEVKDVEPVLTRWIEKTQGRNESERSKRAAGLIWAITVFDLRIQKALDQSENQFEEFWENLIKMTLQERFGHADWMKSWAGKPFNNTFLVRKPRLVTPFLELENGEELAIRDSCRPAMQLMASTFVQSASVRQHIHAPADAWQAMLTLNDGGIRRVSEYLGNVANIDFKLQRINEQLEHCLDDLLHSLNGWYQKDGEGALALKRAQAQMILQELGRKPAILGELIEHLQLPGDTVRDLYLSGAYEVGDEAGAQTDSEQPAAPQSLYGNDGGFDFGDAFASTSDSTPTGKVVVAEQHNSEQRFAKAVLKLWIGQLRDLGNRQNLLNLLGINRKVVEAVVDELITGAYRMGVPEQLSQALLQRAQSGARRDQLVQRQVLAVQLTLRDYVSWFGSLTKPVGERPKSLVGNKDHLFSFYRNPQPGQLPDLPTQPANQAQLFLGDWLSGLAWVTQENAGHSAGREITLEQNEWLGRVLQAFPAR